MHLKTTKSLFAFISVLTASIVLFFNFVFMPIQKNFSKNIEEHKKLENKVLAYKVKVEKLLQYEKKIKGLQNEFNQAAHFFSYNKRLPLLLTEISHAGKKAGLSFILFQPDKETDYKFYRTIPVNIKLQGQYHQILDFFYQIINFNQTINIEAVQIGIVKERENILEMSCKVIAYVVFKEFLEQKQKVSQKHEKNNYLTIDNKGYKSRPDYSNKKNPFMPLFLNLLNKDNLIVQTKVQKNLIKEELEIKPLYKKILTPLEQISTDNMRLVAIIVMQNKKIAMVEDVKNKGYEIEIGTKVGLNKGKVVNIQQNSIEIKEFIKEEDGTVKEQIKELKLFENETNI